MGRGKRALAAVAILAALAAVSIAAAPRAAAEGGELAGELPVAGGVALVSWSGGPAGALAEAARSRGCNVNAVYANAPGGGFVSYVPGASVAAANRAFLAAYPGGLPASPVLVVCGEPALPRIVFLGDVAGERREAIRGEVASVVRFYAERFGAVVPESTLYVSPDREAVAAVYLELTGDEYPLSAVEEGGTATSTAQDGALGFINGGFVNDHPHQFASVLAHEYYHMIQYDILRGRRLHAAPEWLIEGTAEYGKDLYNGAPPYEKLRETWALVLLEIDASFMDVAASFGIQHYRVTASAIGWLVEFSGNPRADLEYWRALASDPDWHAAFVSAFGLTVGEFFDQFDEYRTELRESLPRIRGKVVDLDGTPIPGVYLLANFGDAGEKRTFGITDEAGAFDLPVTDGEWSLWPLWAPGGLYGPFLYNSETGYANSCDVSPPIEIDGSDVSGIVIAISAQLLTQSDYPICNEGRPGYRMIRGAILDSEGERLTPQRTPPGQPDGYQYESSAVEVCVSEILGGTLHGCTNLWDNRDGDFAFYVAEGKFELTVRGWEDYVRYPAGYIDKGWLTRGWHGPGGFTTNRERATLFEVVGADITGIEVRLPVGFRDLPSVVPSVEGSRWRPP